jgi:hypothetical protein
MTLVRFIGDVHGKYGRYKKLIADVENSIQVGDMGVGFRRVGGFRDGELYSNPPHYAMARANHRFIRGNHDNPGECAKHSQWIDDGKIEGDTMFIGGAVSIDRALRQEGYNWWSDEELSAERLNELVDRFVQIRPRVMVTHDCPEEVAVEMERLTCRGKLDPRFSPRSRQAPKADISQRDCDVRKVPIADIASVLRVCQKFSSERGDKPPLRAQPYSGHR